MMQNEMKLEERNGAIKRRMKEITTIQKCHVGGCEIAFVAAWKGGGGGW
jgi:hypothetical protein